LGRRLDVPRDTGRSAWAGPGRQGDAAAGHPPAGPSCCAADRGAAEAGAGPPAAGTGRAQDARGFLRGRRAERRRDPRGGGRTEAGD
jgi:hypothetical protein